MCHQYPQYGEGGPLRAFFQGRITLRHLRVLVERLPATGALARAQAGHHWQHSEFMLADLLDLMGRFRVDFGNANRAEKAPPTPYPDEVWRPTQPSKKKQAKAKRRDHAQARAGYLRIVALATPEYAEKG
ncbi:hypothetical protein [Streptomyces sp. NPDC020607]|uniref:hypothetical protein n=1 Tax=Streptomyces sp. NPDC020607 TaxID=3365082 RepID=UPI0037951781